MADEKTSAKYYLCHGGVVLQIGPGETRQIIGKLHAENEYLVFDSRIDKQSQRYALLPDAVLNPIEIPNFDSKKPRTKYTHFVSDKHLVTGRALRDLVSTSLPIEKPLQGYEKIFDTVNTSAYKNPIKGYYVFFANGSVGFALKRPREFKNFFSRIEENPDKFYTIGTWSYNQTLRRFEATYHSDHGHIGLTGGATTQEDEQIRFGGEIAAKSQHFGVTSLPAIKNDEIASSLNEMRAAVNKQHPLQKAYPKINNTNRDKFLATLKAGGWRVAEIPGKPGEYFLTQPSDFRLPKTFIYYAERNTIGVLPYVNLKTNPEYVDGVAKLVDMLPPQTGMKEAVYNIYTHSGNTTDGDALARALKKEVKSDDLIIKQTHDYDKFCGNASPSKRAAAEEEPDVKPKKPRIVP